jgi:hypothetical protein
MTRAIEDESRDTIILLECGVTIPFRIAPPKTGERVWCFRHRHYARVKDGRAEFRARCRDCRMSRPYGAAKLSAEMSAVRHARAKTHTVDVLQGAKILHTITHESNGQLAMPDDVPPF